MTSEAPDLLSEFIGLSADPSKVGKLLQQAETKLREHELMVRQLKGLIDFLRPLAENVASPEATEKPKRARAGSVTPGARMSIREAMVQVLRKEGAPVAASHLAAAVQELRGVDFTGKRKTGPIYATASQSDELKSSNGLIGLAEWREEDWEAARSRKAAPSSKTASLLGDTK